MKLSFASWCMNIIHNSAMLRFACEMYAPQLPPCSRPLLQTLDFKELLQNATIILILE